MRKGRTNLVKELETRDVLQRNIREKFGEVAIQKAKERLCRECVQTTCFLLPICSDGKDCPYFKKREVEE